MQNFNYNNGFNNMQGCGGYNYIQPQQPRFWSLVLVDSIDEVNRYIVQPNQVVYLKIRNSNFIFEKTANNQGEYSINQYGKIEQKQEKQEFVSMDIFNRFNESLEQRINKLSSDLENVLKQKKEVNLNE